MATNEEVEKAQVAVAALRQKVVQAESSSDASEANNEITLYELNKETEELEARLAESEATKQRQHEAAANPMEFAAAMLTRDEVKDEEKKPEKKVTSKSDNSDEATTKSERVVK